jgi:pyruvate ferredoxin oxidoreductase alpha subunit
MSNVVAYSGNDAVAEAMRQINPDVVAAYPITPQTEIVQKFAQFVADGEVDTVFVTVESEHSAMSACIGAAAGGGRVMTATSACGFALMWEVLYCASGMRLPIVMTVVNRALNAPLNIHGDHSDSMGGRDCGWIQLYCENAQEAYDNVFQAIQISEHLKVRLPVMVCFDGFIISHSLERMELLDDKAVKDFVGSYKPLYSLMDTENPKTFGPVDLQDYYTEHKRQQVEAMKEAKPVILDVAKEFERRFGRKYGLFETYRLEDAELAIVVLNSAAGTVKDVVDEWRNKGVKVGSLKPRVFRPFPNLELAEALKNAQVVAVLDRADSFGGMGGPVFVEVRSALYDLPKLPKSFNYIYGLGGRDLLGRDVDRVIERMIKVQKGEPVGDLHDYLTVRQ